MTPNFPILLACAFIPMITGMIWYNPKVFGKAWQKVVGLTEDQANETPKWYQFVLAIFLNFLLSLGIAFLTVHQIAIFSLVGGDVELLKAGTAAAFLGEYGGEFLTVGHGVAHGIAAFLFIALPFIGGPAIWEKKSFKYVLINGMYWFFTILIMTVIIAKYGGSAIV